MRSTPPSLCVLLLLTACRTPPTTETSAAPGESTRRPPADTTNSAPSPSSSVSAAMAASAASPAKTATLPLASATQVAGGEPFAVDLVQDLGPEAAMVATADGVLALGRKGELVRASLRKLAAPRARPAASPLEAFPTSLEAQRGARGPAVARGHAHYVQNGKLYRRSLSGGEADALASDARDGARVAALDLGARTLVAYVTRGEDALGVSVWSEGRGSVPAVADGAAAHSVALAATDEGAWLVYLDARTGMSQLHVRLVDSSLALGEDRVVWVGGAAHSTSEVVVGATRPPTALLAFEEDSAHFGLARIALDPSAGAGEATTRWVRYANGLAPAPVAAATLCSVPYVAFVRPVDATRGAPREIALAPLAALGLAEPRVVASARVVTDLSLAATAGGAVLAWTAEGRTWGLTLRCR